MSHKGVHRELKFHFVLHYGHFLGRELLPVRGMAQLGEWAHTKLSVGAGTLFFFRRTQIRE